MALFRCREPGSSEAHHEICAVARRATLVEAVTAARVLAGALDLMLRVLRCVPGAGAAMRMQRCDHASARTTRLTSRATHNYRPRGQGHRGDPGTAQCACIPVLAYSGKVPWSSRGDEQ
eukprot:7081851-Prymnesium_polylepis.1